MQHANLADTLVEGGFIERDNIVSITPLYQRNLCYRIRTVAGPDLFAKQAARVMPDQSNVSDVRHESKVHCFVNEVLPLRRYTARFLGDVDNNEGECVIVSEWVDGAEPLNESRRRSGWSPDLLSEVGMMLATLHSYDTSGPTLPRVRHIETVRRNWDELTPSKISMFPGGYREMVMRIRAAQLEDPIDALCRAWSYSAVIHGDIKSDNLLVTQVAPKLIDWEVGGLGDPRWDVGSLIGDVVTSWVGSMQVGQGDLESWIGNAEPATPILRIELSSFVNGYRALARLTEADLQIALGYAGVFLLQRVCGTAMHTPVLPFTALALLQVTNTLLLRTDDALEVLL